MKKLLLLLLLPVCLLAQEDKKPRKLFLELKQGVGLPSIGIKYKNPKGNYWNVGVNTVDINFPIKKSAYSSTITEIGPYVSHSILLEKRFQVDLGLSTIMDGEYFGILSYTGIFYGRKTAIGLNFGLTHIRGYTKWIDNGHYEIIPWHSFMVISPTLKFKL